MIFATFGFAFLGPFFGEGSEVWTEFRGGVWGAPGCFKVHFWNFCCCFWVDFFWVDPGWVVVFTHPVSQFGDLCLDEKVPVLGLRRQLGQRAIVQKLVLALSYFKS